MPGIKTSAITYRRGISNSSPNFFLVAQANYVIPQPTSRFRQNNVTSVAPIPPPPPPPPTNPTTFTFTPLSGFGPITTTSSTISSTSYLGRTNALLSVEIGTSCTSIADFCFNACSNLNSVTFLGNSVTNIGQYVFNQCSFSSITIPSSVTSLGNHCFSSNLALQTVTFDVGSTINSLPTACFSNCQTLTSINIPNSVTQLGDNCLDQCYLLNDPNVLPVSVTSIGISCFQNCQALTSINLPPLLTSIPYNCFRNCSILQSVNYLGNLITSFDELAFAECPQLTSIIIPNSVTSLGKNCFLFCVDLTAVTIGSSVTLLGDSCFLSCGKLTSLTIPTSVQVIGPNILSFCNLLTSLTFNNPNSITTDIPSGTEGILANINNTVVVTFDGLNNWSGLNSFVKNYFPEDPSSVVPTNYPTTMSYNFVPWSAFGTGLSDSAYALVKTSNALYVGGAFLTAGGVTVNNVAKWNGSAWSSLENGIFGGTNFPVYALAEDSLGNIYVGGFFINVQDSFGSIPGTSRIAKWDGSSWSALASGINDGQVNSIATSGSDVYAGGTFTVIGSTDGPNRIAKWDGSSWSRVGYGANNVVNAIAVSGSDVYIGGNFTSVFTVDVFTPVSANRIAKWDTNTSSWSALGGGVSGQVIAIAISGNDVYVGGLFMTAESGSISVFNIAKWNGTSWSSLGNGIGGTVNSIVISGSDVYVGGAFTTTGDGVTVNNAAKWDTLTSSWSALPIGSLIPGTNNTVNALDINNLASELYLGGSFTTAGTVTVNRVASYII